MKCPKRLLRKVLHLINSMRPAAKSNPCCAILHLRMFGNLVLLFLRFQPFKINTVIRIKKAAGSLNQKYTDTQRHLVEACKAGNRKAYNELYTLYSRAMYNLCHRMMNDAEEARDLMQEGFIEAFRRLDSFRFESTFGAWLKKIVVNKCINALEKRRIEWVDIEIAESSLTTEDQDTIDEEKLRLSVERVKNAMNRLPEGARVIFSLYLIEGYDHTEIAEILKISESTSKSQFMRARQLVKNILISMPEAS